jgi:hypothetical protein
MNPQIETTTFGSITINAQTYEHDVIINLKGKVKKRKKKLSKAIYGTSHTLSLEEAEYIFEPGTERLIIGTGQYGMLKLSDEASDYFQRRSCITTLLPTGEALRVWNAAEGNVIGLFHITC